MIKRSQWRNDEVEERTIECSHQNDAGHEACDVRASAGRH